MPTGTSDPLQGTLELYDGHLYPLISLVTLLKARGGIRQLATEVRNCHTHLYWAYHQPGADGNNHLPKAADHLLRAVVDGYKIVLDHVLNLVPESAPHGALRERLLAERCLDAVWGQPARDSQAQNFQVWRDALAHGLTAAKSLYSGIPVQVFDLHRLLGAPGRTVLLAARERLSSFVGQLAPLLRFEHAYRLYQRGRVEGHGQRHLGLFEELMKFLAGEEDRYAKEVTMAVADHRQAAYKYVLSLCGDLLMSLPKDACSHGEWGAIIRDYQALDIADGAPTDDALAQARALFDRTLAIEAGEDVPADCQLPYAERMSPEALRHALSKQFPDLDKELLDRAAQAYNELDDVDLAVAPALLANTVRQVLTTAPDRAAAGTQARLLKHQLDKVTGGSGRIAEERDRYLHLYHILLQEQNEAEQALKAVVGPRYRAVWFADIVHSTAAGSPANLHAALYDLAVTVWRKCSREHGQGVPVLANTWGDAIMAVFDEAALAAEAALGLIELAHVAGINLRIGAASGELDVRKNPIIGMDAFGGSLAWAARLEPLASPGEVLGTEDFYLEVAEHSDFLCTPVTRKLLKPMGNAPAGEECRLYVIARAPSP